MCLMATTLLLSSSSVTNQYLGTKELVCSLIMVDDVYEGPGALTDNTNYHAARLAEA